VTASPNQPGSNTDSAVADYIAWLRQGHER
jgi:hypothetical protein